MRAAKPLLTLDFIDAHTIVMRAAKPMLTLDFIDAHNLVMLTAKPLVRTTIDPRLHLRPYFSNASSEASGEYNYWVLGHFGHGHFGLGRFGLDISATDVSATENVEGGRFGHSHKFWVWDVCMHKKEMHFISF